MNKLELMKTANEVRKGIVTAVHSAKSGHPGGSLSAADIYTYLYFEEMNIDPKDPKKADRDRFVLSKGHAGPAVYATLALKGFLKEEELDTLNRPGTHLPSHCDMRLTNGVDMTTGSLGQGFSAAVGMALSAKLSDDAYRVYTLLGDGEIQEGQVWEAAQADKRDLNVYTIIGDGESQEGQIWEAALLAGDRKLDNLIAFTDYNKMQIDGYVGDVNTLDPLEDKWKAFGWDVQSVDGHDIQQILYAIDNAKKEKGRPSMIILNTIKGKGVYFAENLVACHNMTITEEMWKKAVDMIDKEEI